MTIRSVATIFAALTVLVIILQSWRVAASVDPDEHARLTEAIRAGQELDARLERLILETRAGMPGAHDKLALALRDGQLTKQMLSPDLIPSTQLRRNLNGNLERCLSQLHEKAGRISDFMNRNRELADELRAFPQAVELFVAHSDQVSRAERARVASVTREVMQLAFDHENHRYIQQRDALARIAPGKGATAPILRRARAIAQRTKSTDARLDGVLEIPLRESLAQLDVVVQSSFRSSASRAFAQRFALTLMATMLFGYGFLSVMNLRRSTRELMQSNEDLDVERLDRERLVDELRDRIRLLEDFDRSPAAAELARISKQSAEDLGESVRALYASCRELVREGGEDLSDESTGTLIQMAESAARVRDGVRLVRELARVTSETTALTEVSLEAALTAAEESCRSRLELAGLEFKREPAPPAVLGDLMLIREILRNAVGFCVGIVGPRRLNDRRFRPLQIDVARESDYIVLVFKLPQPGLPETIETGLLREAVEILGGALGTTEGDGQRDLKILLPPSSSRVLSGR